MRADISYVQSAPRAEDIAIGETFIWSKTLYMRVQPGGFYFDNLMRKGALDKENIHCVSLVQGALIVLGHDTVVTRKACKVVDNDPS